MLIKQVDALRKALNPKGDIFRSGMIQWVREAMQSLVDLVEKAKEVPRIGDTSKVEGDLAIVKRGIITIPHPKTVKRRTPKPALNLGDELDDYSNYDDFDDFSESDEDADLDDSEYHLTNQEEHQAL